jgi:hypothetical protein
MKKLISVVLISLLLFAGFSFAIVKAPSTTIKTNITPITVVKINATKVPTNLSNETTLPQIKPDLTVIDVVKTPPKNDTAVSPITCVSCAKANLTVLLPNVTLDTGTCSQSEVGGLLRYSHHYGHHAHFDMPDYLDDVREDCDLLGLDDEITEDLNAKLANVSQIEDEINAVENESNSLVERGLEAIECLREAQEVEPAEPDPSRITITPMLTGRTYPSFPSRSYLGGSYMLSGMFDYVATKLENFNYAYENVYTGHNHTEAAMENLENITLGLEDFCRKRECVWPEDKDFYERLLEHEQRNAQIYANRTKLFIDDARDFAQNYHDLKGGIDRIECMEFMLDTTNAPWMNMDLENVTNDTPIQVISPVKLALNYTGVENVTLVGGEKPKYVIQSKQKKKLLWMFEVEVETKAEVNAQNGQIIKEEKPWWSFLLTG